MKNVLVLLLVFALIGSASAVYAPNSWGFAKTGAGNPYEFNGTGYLTNQTPDVWGTWGAGGGAGNVTVSGGQCTMVTDSWELAFSHDNALVDIGNPIPGVDGIDVVLTVVSVTGGGYLSMKLECFPVGVSFPNPDNGTGNIGIADFEAAGAEYLVTGPGVYTFRTTDIGFEIPAGTVAVTPVIVAAGGTVTGVIDEIELKRATSTKATNPNPGNGAESPAITELSWRNADPINPADVITSDVYFLESTSLLPEDPNMNPDNNDSGSTIIDAGSAETVAIPEAFLPLQDGYYYYWAVHCTDPNTPNTSKTTYGDVWYFHVGDTPPVPNAGPDEFAWVAKDDGEDSDPTTYTFVLTGTYTDDGKSPISDANFVNLNAGLPTGVEKISQTWTPGPGVHTSGTVVAKYRSASTTTIPGWWDMQLEVTDASGTGIDVAYLRLEADCASAADSDASDDFDITYDVNRDCKNDLTDFAAFAAVWLDQSVKYQP